MALRRIGRVKTCRVGTVRTTAAQRSEPAVGVGDYSMGIFQNARCRVGSHTGEWTYDRYGACDQTRTCTNCSTESERTRHSFGGWEWVDPADPASCRSSRECSRCGKDETEDRHTHEWRYYRDFLEARLRDSGETATFKGVLIQVAIEVEPKCKQRLICPRCGDVGMSAERVEHDWGAWQPGRGGSVSVRSCERCGTREENS